MREFGFQPVAVVDVQRLHDDEQCQQPPCFSDVVPVAHKLGNQSCLPGNMFLTLGHVMARLQQMNKPDAAVHVLSIAQAGNGGSIGRSARAYGLDAGAIRPQQGVFRRDRPLLPAVGFC